ncbi:hypothetical protein NC651_020535 [Populus alba x Populus x berolinensis]|nr:hypothetical protein NC651_020535 [Populus alba x Populus x berolinensis]
MKQPEYYDNVLGGEAEFPLHLRFGILGEEGMPIDKTSGASYIIQDLTYGAPWDDDGVNRSVCESVVAAPIQLERSYPGSQQPWRYQAWLSWCHEAGDNKHEENDILIEENNDIFALLTRNFPLEVQALSACENINLANFSKKDGFTMFATREGNETFRGNVLREFKIIQSGESMENPEGVHDENKKSKNTLPPPSPPYCDEAALYIEEHPPANFTGFCYC